MRPRLLDLFCGAGGASRGYADAGFDVVGVDIKTQPNYPFFFECDDALLYMKELRQEIADQFDAIHASPPCQHFTRYGNSIKDIKDRYQDLLEPTRELLQATGLPYVIENVEGAPLNDPLMLCGSMFDMDIQRHRLFETNFPVEPPVWGCRHKIGPKPIPRRWVEKTKPDRQNGTTEHTGQEQHGNRTLGSAGSEAARSDGCRLAHDRPRTLRVHTARLHQVRGGTTTRPHPGCGMTDLGFEHDEFGIVVPLDIGERANLTGYNNPAALNAVPLNGHHVPNGDGTRWPTVNLADPAYAIPPDPPAIAGLLYEGKRHVASGPQESAKTLIAYHLLLLAMRQGSPVAVVDLEMGPVATRRMLTDLGATNAELGAIHYTEPNGPPTEADIRALALHGVRYVLIDAAAGAFDLSGLDDNSRKDAEKWARAWVQPLFALGIATIVLDHVTKNVEGRGKYAIGSERKTGGADVHLGFDALKTLTRGGQGVVKVTAHKDRGAYLERPTAAIIKLQSDPDTHAITINIEPPETIDPTEPVKHTIYAERVSKTLEANNGEPMSQTQVTQATEGKDIHIHQAINELAAAGNITIENGPRNAKIITLITPYTHTPSHPFPTPSGSGHLTTPSPGLSPYGEARVGEGVSDTPEKGSTPSPEIDIYDPAIQHLMDDPEP